MNLSKNQIAKRKEEIREYLPRRSFHLYSYPLIFFFIKPRPARDTTRGQSISMQTICSAPDSAHYGVQ